MRIKPVGDFPSSQLSPQQCKMQMMCSICVIFLLVHATQVHTHELAALAARSLQLHDKSQIHFDDIMLAKSNDYARVLTGNATADGIAQQRSDGKCCAGCFALNCTCQYGDAHGQYVSDGDAAGHDYGSKYCGCSCPPPLPSPSP
eukprot:gnl/TRDRNA2_/TRDRNA2_75842_c0_seq1.p1 gnl/TRDRNA2_/TRDRNA2_75842_c0~~gnl/TRDRNA2_/TRDRNA2_75842_c0_seq1.p1  ORF type:complete len:145 (-),score=16.71 gnl/TRDRNA2_/TRDRNA2_75842_c0_seq1:224-658(-)